MRDLTYVKYPNPSTIKWKQCWKKKNVNYPTIYHFNFHTQLKPVQLCEEMEKKKKKKKRGRKTYNDRTNKYC
jgi:hypothetical protein